MDKQLMREGLNAIKKSIVEGARETPRAFFAPLIELGRWIVRVRDAGTAPPLSHFTLSLDATKALAQTAERRAIAPQVALELAIHEFSARDSSPSKGATT